MQRINLTAKSIVPRIVNAAQKNQQCRKMGGGGHGGGNHAAAKHGHAEPYAAKHGKDYPDVAYPFGIVPGAPLQGWEIPTYGFYFASFLICFIGIGYCKTDTRFTVRKYSTVTLHYLKPSI
jgi:galactokinase